MKVIPAIDLKEGRCVRLLRGNFDRTTEYDDNPTAVAMRFAELAVSDLHVVDLDGARTGRQANSAAIRDITLAAPLAVQVGGGLRDKRGLEHWFAHGVSRCVVGSVAVEDPVTVMSWLAEFGPDRIVIALDVRIGDDGQPYVATRGWTTTSSEVLWDCLVKYHDAGARHVLCTDIGRDGAMTGPAVELYAEIVARYPRLELQASGGVRGADDLDALRRCGAAAAITGRALLDGRISAEEIATFQPSA